MQLNLIWAQGANKVIGRNGGLPWPAFREDMYHFQKETIGHIVIMGRLTWDSLPQRYRPLPNRRNIVISASKGFDSFVGAIHVNSVRSAVSMASDPSVEKAFVIGGSRVYQDTIAVADRLIVTEIEQEFQGDTFAPEIDESIWVSTVKEQARSIAGFNYQIIEYLRKPL